MRAYWLLGLLAFGCSEGTRVNVTKTIGTSGGTVNASTGTAVQIPAGALAAQAMITIQSVDAPAPAGNVIVGQAYDFGPEGATFSSAVTITLPIDTSKIPAGRTNADVHIFTAPRGSSDYTLLPTTVNGALATTMTTHFTVYLPAVPVAGTVADFSAVPADMALASGDMSVSRDMATSSDLTNSCTPVYATSTSGCTVTSTCSGTTYKLNCAPASGAASCFCTINGATTTGASLPTGCNESDAKSLFSSTCLG